METNFGSARYSSISVASKPAARLSTARPRSLARSFSALGSGGPPLNGPRHSFRISSKSRPASSQSFFTTSSRLSRLSSTARRISIISSSISSTARSPSSMDSGARPAVKGGGPCWSGSSPCSRSRLRAASMLRSLIRFRFWWVSCSVAQSSARSSAGDGGCVIPARSCGRSGRSSSAATAPCSLLKRRSSTSS